MPNPSRRLLLAAAACLALPRAARAAEPRRIVALGGAVTEIPYALGADARIAAVDTTSLFPERALREKPNVGYLRARSAEGILSARPDLVIAAEGAGPPDALALVREAGVPVASVVEAPTEAGVLDRIAQVGRHAGLVDEAAALGERVRADFAALASERARIARPARAGDPLAPERARARGRSRQHRGRHPRARRRAQRRRRPRGLQADGGRGDHRERPRRRGDDAHRARERHGGQRVRATRAGPDPAGAHRALVTLDGLLLLGFGPRTPQAARELMWALHPDLRRVGRDHAARGLGARRARGRAHRPPRHPRRRPARCATSPSGRWAASRARPGPRSPPAPPSSSPC